jgi:hypothetical protein
MTQKVVTSEVAVTGLKHFFRLYYLLLKGTYTSNVMITFVLVPTSNHSFGLLGILGHFQVQILLHKTGGHLSWIRDRVGT